jgi:hypothetical protein
MVQVATAFPAEVLKRRGGTSLQQAAPAFAVSDLRNFQINPTAPLEMISPAGLGPAGARSGDAATLTGLVTRLTGLLRSGRISPWDQIVVKTSRTPCQPPVLGI